MPDTNISEEHHRAFEALTSGRFDNFCLVSCFVDGEPTAAIAAVNLSPPAQDGGEPEVRWSLFLGQDGGRDKVYSIG